MEELDACGSCLQPMHRAAVRCPRCSAFQRRFASPPDASPKGYREADRPSEPAELGRAASITVRARRGRARDEPHEEPGVFSGLLLPAPHTRGIVRVIELALTVFALPLLGSAALGLVLLLIASFDLPWTTQREIRAPARMFRALGIVVGMPVLFVGLEMIEMPFEASAIVIALQLGAVLARTGLRRAALVPRRLDLDA